MSSPPKRLLLWPLVVVALVVIVGGGAVWLTRPGPLEAAHEQLREGMSRDEVHSLIGEPKKSLEYSMHVDGLLRGGWCFILEETWEGADGTLLVIFENEKVSHFEFKPNEDLSHLQKVRRQLRSWLGL